MIRHCSKTAGQETEVLPFYYVSVRYNRQNISYLIFSTQKSQYIFLVSPYISTGTVTHSQNLIIYAELEILIIY